MEPNLHTEPPCQLKSSSVTSEQEPLMTLKDDLLNNGENEIRHPRGHEPAFSNPYAVNHYYGPIIHRATNVHAGPNHGTVMQWQSNEPGQTAPMTVLKFLAENMAPGAMHDSEERCDAPKCMPETRVAVQDEIFSWVTDGHTEAAPKKILWVTGPAGTGKTAILGTIADRYKEEGRLAASFFFSSFSGSADRRSKVRLIPTLAYQLLQHATLRDTGAHLAAQESIERDPVILKKRLQAQLDALVLDPLRARVRQHENGSPQPYIPMTIIIDGLDECDFVENASPERGAQPRSKEDEQREILSVLLRAALDPIFPFTIIIASRPERAIRDFFDTTAKDQTRTLFLDETYNPDADIRLFYNSRFSHLRRLFRLPDHWPGEVTIDLLVENASGQFVYAATTVRFIEGASMSPGNDGNTLNWHGLTTPDQRLKRILQLRPTTRSSWSSPKPFERLDILYRSIIDTCPDRLLSMNWLHVIKVLKTYPPEFRTTGGAAPCWLIRLILELSPGEGQYALGTLASLLTEKKYSGSHSRNMSYIIYSFYHKSFLDFIDEPERCGDLFVPRVEARDFLTRRFFQTLRHHPNTVRVEDPKLRYYHTLGTDKNLLLSFSSKQAFKAAEADMLACDVHEWLPLALHDSKRWSPATQIREIVLWVVHSRCTWYRCRPSCKHWRGTALEEQLKKN
ncbi:hypothetical protein D9611_011680 [Ephemerocybe angulata]|uniref:NACHT domain-containing protein n=1 Tax=Ephemerocybe angulata TaxID=980116 RepID=A0A8H5C7D4_9AGAR|nr:hypothetical protein D9611_011680 [Tulosesus angulatus]